MWRSGNISMSLTYTRIGTSSRGEVAIAFVHHSCTRALQANRLAGVIENNSEFEVCMVVRFLRAEGVSESEIHCRLVFTASMFSAERNYLCGAVNFNMAEQH
jgi:hypothetical protein